MYPTSKSKSTNCEANYSLVLEFSLEHDVKEV